MLNKLVYSVYARLKCPVALLLSFLLVALQAVAQNPNPPVIDSLSVVLTPDNGYKVALGWQSYDWTGYDPDSSGFIVREVIPNVGYANPDTIYNAFETGYIDLSSEPLSGLYGYGLVAFTTKDGIFLKSQIADLYSRNIRLQNGIYDSCNMAFNLEWNSYFGDEASPQQIDPVYKILITSATDNRIEFSDDVQYIVRNLVKNESYQFRIRVEADSWSSTSAPVSFVALSPAIPQIPIIREISTDSDFETEIVTNVDQENSVSAALFGARQWTNEYELFDSLPVISTEIALTHNNLEKDVYRYLVRSWNVCSDASESKPLNSIVLSGVRTDSYVRLLANEVEGIEGAYTLTRTVNDENSVFVLAPPLEFTDTEVFNMALESPYVTYRVSFRHGDSIMVHSNPYTISISDDLRWPNAIVAGHYGDDGAFRPFAERSDPNEYNLKIYSKWGELVFESNNIENAWRGKYKGIIVMPGAYLYICTYKYEGKKARVVKGTVTVIH